MNEWMVNLLITVATTLAVAPVVSFFAKKIIDHYFQRKREHLSLTFQAIGTAMQTYANQATSIINASKKQGGQ
jgi:hypothetical protein